VVLMRMRICRVLYCKVESGVFVYFMDRFRGEKKRVKGKERGDVMCFAVEMKCGYGYGWWGFCVVRT
jgi:hypothetical protein